MLLAVRLDSVVRYFSEAVPIPSVAAESVEKIYLTLQSSFSSSKLLLFYDFTMKLLLGIGRSALRQMLA